MIHSLKFLALLTILPIATACVATDHASQDHEPETTAPGQTSPNRPLAGVRDDLEHAGELFRLEHTDTSMTPSADFSTSTGSRILIWVYEDGSSTVFEAVPEGAESALRDSTADSPSDLFAELATEGLPIPQALSNGRRFSLLEAEAAERYAALPEEERTMVEEEVDSDGAQVVPYAASYCAKSETNAFYASYRPGVYDNSEGVLEYTSANFQYREARRRKDYQDFAQTSFDRWTPRGASGGLQASYMRATLHMCVGTARLALYRCASSQGTADNGCGAPGSSIANTAGPITIYDGGTYTFKDFPGFDLARARLSQMGGSDLALWSVMMSGGSYGSINRCYN